MTTRIHLSIFLFSWFGTLAQPYTSRLGRFQVDEIKGCAPHTITITILPAYTTECPPCTMDFQGNGQRVNYVLTYTYNNPGVYKLEVLFSNIGADDIIITVDQNIQPAYNISSCAGSQVQVNISDKNYDQYIIDFNSDGIIDKTIASGNNQVATFIYPSPGNKTISIRGKDLNAADNCLANQQVFNALASLPAASLNTLTVQDINSIDMEYLPAANMEYRLEVAVNNSSNFQQFKTITSATATLQTEPLTNLVTDANYYCLRLSTYDPCNNNLLPSNTVCSINFDLNIFSDINKLSWVTSTTGISTFDISRNNVLPYFSTPGLNFDDTNIICATDYCYRVTGQYGNGSRSISLEKCGKSFTNKIPTPIENISSDVNIGGLDLMWIQDPAFNAQVYFIYRSLDGNVFSTINQTTVTTYTDTDYTNDLLFTYRIDYLDICQLTSQPGKEFQPIRLVGNVNDLNEITLSWNSYKGWINGVKSYTIEKYGIQGGLIKTYVSTDTTFIDNEIDPLNQEVYYRIIANPNQTGITTSKSNKIKLTRSAKLFFPTAFTPNKDNLNDGFRIYGQYVDRVSLKIFDRWGEMLFSTEENKPWDGTYKEVLMPESNYIWKALVIDQIGREFHQTGTVALLRK